MLTHRQLEAMPDSEVRQKLEWRHLTPAAALQLVRYRKHPHIARAIRRILGRPGPR